MARLFLLSSPLPLLPLIVGSPDILRLLQQLEQSDATLTAPIRVFDREGGQFEVYGAAAHRIALLLHASAAVTSVQGIPVLRTNSPAQLTGALRTLLPTERIEIWSFHAARRSWRISCRASPGNVEAIEELFTEWAGESTVAEGSDSRVEAASFIAVVNPLDDCLIFAALDLTRMLFTWCSLASMSDLETVLVQVDARELLHPQNRQLDFDGGEEASLSIIKTPLPVADFDSSNDEDIRRLLCPSLGPQVSSLPRPLLASLMALTKYLGLLSSDTNLGVFGLETIQLDRYVRLDECALRSLGVFGTGTWDVSSASSPPSLASSSSTTVATAMTAGTTAITASSTSLYGLLNQCKTRQGARLLAQWIRQPLRDLTELRDRQAMVSVLVEEGAPERQELRELVLRGIPDIARITRRLVRERASLADLVLLWGAVTKIDPIERLLDRLADPTMTRCLVNPLRVLANALARYGTLIEETVDMEALARHEYLIRADVQAPLAALATQRDALLESMQGEFERVARLLDLELGKRIKLERNSTYGYHLRVSRRDAGGLASRLPGGHHELAALKSGVLFVTGPLRDASLQFDELGREYGRQQQAIVTEMLAVAKTYRRPFGELNDLIATIDVLQSLAHVALTSPLPYVRPELVSAMEEEAGAETTLTSSNTAAAAAATAVTTTRAGALLSLQGMRHPCVEWQTEFIANDVEISTHDACSLQVITGPNMGGKSTFIRSVALCTLLAQIGSWVPCSAARLTPVDAILVRVGAGDSILRGISTFMAEMLEMSSILRLATPRSLLIIDELGRGTATSEGLGLAWAVVRRLAKLGAPTLFATHFHELTRMQGMVPGVGNLHMETTGSGLISGNGGGSDLLMTFRVRPGGCDRSYGLQCAQRAGFPENVLNMARIILRDLETGGAAFTEEEAREGLAYLERIAEARGTMPGGGDSLSSILANAPAPIRALLLTSSS